MKLTCFLLFVSLLQVGAKGSAQTITWSGKNASVKEVFSVIKNQTGYVFFYNYNILKDSKPVSISVKDTPLEKVLQLISDDQPFLFSIVEKTIVVSERKLPLHNGSADSAKALNNPPQILLQGKVINEEGTPLVGVTIRVKGTDQGIVSDANGSFKLEVSNDAILEISYIGFQSQEVQVGAKSEITILMHPLASGLNQIVVVGYGTQEKEKITSSISEVNTADLKDLPIATSGQLLEGRAGGVTVTEGDGAPGTPSTILIHGISSINAGIGPLIVVNGFPVGNEIPASLNPNDIEKITVLKDAASTSIYGARGSNGVILIQTTKAVASQSVLEYNVYGGVQYVPRSWRPKVLNALQYAQYNKERVDETNQQNNTHSAVPQIFTDVLANPQKYGAGTNWQDIFFREGTDAPIQNHHLTFRAGNEVLKGVISGSYLDQAGVIPHSDFKRYSMRTNLEGAFGKKFKIGGNLSVAHTENNEPDQNIYGQWGVVMETVVASPLQSPYDKDGHLIPFLPADAPGYFAYPNPLYVAQVTKDNTVGRDMNAGMHMDIEILKGLHYKPQLYTRVYTQEENTFIPSTIGQSQIGTVDNLSLGAPPYPNSASSQKYDITNWGMDNLLTYDKQLGPHSLSILAGYTAQKQTGQLSEIDASNFPTDNNLNYLEASQISATVSDYTNWSLAALFGRINYDYKGKYLVEANFRREGSSRFGKSNKYGNFPSASVGWRISQENFFPKDVFVNELKIRGSYGKTGNSAIGDFDQYGQIISIPNLSNLAVNYNYVLGNSTAIGKALTALGDENLKWETSSQLDIGLTMGLFNNRVTLKADYYRMITSNMLFDVSLPQASGFASTRINAGKMLNTGWDFEASSAFRGKNFSWNGNLTVSILHNEVTYIPPQISKITSTYNVTQVGDPVGALYGYKIDGIFNTQKQLDDPKLAAWTGARGLGAFIFEDINGDGEIDARDKTVIGNPHPRLVLGLNNVLTYKNLTLSVLATGAFGFKILPEKNEWLYNEKGRWNVSTEFLHGWKSQDDPGKGIIPAIYYPGQHTASSAWIESGNYVWIKNVTLGYKIPSLLLNKTKIISDLRVYLSVRNALRFTNYTGWNPEVSTYGGTNAQTFGVDNFSYPIARTYTIGADISL